MMSVITSNKTYIEIAGIMQYIVYTIKLKSQTNLDPRFSKNLDLGCVKN